MLRLHMQKVHGGDASFAATLCILHGLSAAYPKTARRQGNLKTGDKMSMIEANRANTAVGGAGIVARITSLVAGWQEARVTRRELNRLSDRELDDIGLCRADIERIARGL
ncbi:DUF1127 domain-containing protein [Paracoccus sp. NSM]|uniref:DUF1127 domain-containing protein n=1 Tax=Paracoccus sp. NSM TaxID=3457784 RepID=UPI004036A6C0